MIRFVDNGDRASHGSDASIDNLSPFSVVMWFRPDTATVYAELWSKISGGVGRAASRDESTGTYNGIGLYVSRASGYDARESTAFMTAGEAYFLCWSYSTANRCRLYFGTLTAAVAECSYNVIDEAGSGALGDDSGQSLLIGGRVADAPCLGDIGRVGYFSAELSLADFERLRRHAPSLWETLYPSCELATGYVDTADLSDVTSNSNDGTNTGGATATDPAYPGVSPWFAYHQMRQG